MGAAGGQEGVGGGESGNGGWGGARSYKGCVLSFDIETTGLWKGSIITVASIYDKKNSVDKTFRFVDIIGGRLQYKRKPAFKLEVTLNPAP